MGFFNFLSRGTTEVPETVDLEMQDLGGDFDHQNIEQSLDNINAERFAPTYVGTPHIKTELYSKFEREASDLMAYVQCGQSFDWRIDSRTMAAIYTTNYMMMQQMIELINEHETWEYRNVRRIRSISNGRVAFFSAQPMGWNAKTIELTRKMDQVCADYLRYWSDNHHDPYPKKVTEELRIYVQVWAQEITSVYRNDFRSNCWAFLIRMIYDTLKPWRYFYRFFIPCFFLRQFTSGFDPENGFMYNSLSYFFILMLVLVTLSSLSNRLLELLFFIRGSIDIDQQDDSNDIESARQNETGIFGKLFNWSPWSTSSETGNPSDGQVIQLYPAVAFIESTSATTNVDDVDVVETTNHAEKNNDANDSSNLDLSYSFDDANERDQPETEPSTAEVGGIIVE